MWFLYCLTVLKKLTELSGFLALFECDLQYNKNKIKLYISALEMKVQRKYSNISFILAFWEADNSSHN